MAVAEDGEIAGFTVGTLEPAHFSSRLMKGRLIHFGTTNLRACINRPHNIPRLLRVLHCRGDAGIPIDGALLGLNCVRGEQQGKSIVRAIMERSALGTANSGASRSYLTTDADGNDRVNRFYQSLG